jgi:hypothetical protein
MALIAMAIIVHARFTKSVPPEGRYQVVTQHDALIPFLVLDQQTGETWLRTGQGTAALGGVGEEGPNGTLDDNGRVRQVKFGLGSAAQK